MKGLRILLRLSFMLLFMAAFQVNAQYAKTGSDTGKITPLLYLGMQLSSDSTKDENIVIKFKKGALMDYEIDEDGRYSSRYEDLHICSVSSDGIPLVTNVIPFPALTPEIVRLYVCPQNGGLFKFRFTAILEIPEHLKIKLIDKYTNRVVEVKQGMCFSFNIDKNALLSFGDRRFMLVIYQDQNYAFRAADFGIGNNKKRTDMASTTAFAQGIQNLQ